MRINTVGIYVGSVLVSLLMSVAPLSAADPVLGVWKLNLKKSTYKPGPAPKSQIRTYEIEKDGVNTTVVNVDAEGKISTSKFKAYYDGKDYPITGESTTSADALSYHKVDDHIAEVVLKHGDMIVANSVRSVSNDGMTLTITYKGSDSRGVQVDDVSVYDRQK